MTLKSTIVAFGALVGTIAGTTSESFADGIIGVRLDEKPKKNGILVIKVVGGSPADQAGLRVDSVITHVDREPVETMAGCQQAISRHSPGERVRLTVVDDGETIVLPVLVVARDAQFTVPKVRDSVKEALEEVNDVRGTAVEDLRRPRRPIYRVYLNADNASDRSLKFLMAFDQLKELSIDRLDRTGRMTGTGLAHLSGLEKLQKLAFPGGAFDATLAKRVCRVPQIQSLILTKAEVTREALQEIVTGLKLTELVLNGVELNDDDLEPIGQMSSLRKLNLNNTQVKGPGLRHLKPLSRLTHLYLGGTGADDEGLANLADMTQLVELRLSHTAVTDTGLPHLKKMERLERLDLDDSGKREFVQESRTSTRVGGVAGTVFDPLDGLVASGTTRFSPEITADGLEKNLKHLTNLRELLITGPDFEPSEVRHFGHLWPKARIVTSRKIIARDEASETP